MNARPPHSDDASFHWLYKQIRELTQRLERVEGKCEQLRCESIQPGNPDRREFQALESRVARLENPTEPTKG
jgi:hypothetical protein